jgi:hypothetical protein
MTIEKIDAVLTKYIVALQDKGVTPRRHSEMAIPSRLSHVMWMCIDLKGWLCEEKKEKAMRWLGFIQGALWSSFVYTIEDLKQHNKP